MDLGCVPNHAKSHSVGSTTPFTALPKKCTKVDFMQPFKTPSMSLSPSEDVKRLNASSVTQ